MRRTRPAPFSTRSSNTRPRDVIDVGRAWVRGEVRMGDARRAAFAANAAHVAAHDLGAAAYAIRAVLSVSAGETQAARIRE
jgi:hypothetical protein